MTPRTQNLLALGAFVAALVISAFPVPGEGVGEMRTALAQPKGQAAP